MRVCSRKGMLGRSKSPVDVSLLVARLPCGTKTHMSHRHHQALTRHSKLKNRASKGRLPRPPDRTACMDKPHTEQEDQAHQTSSWTVPHPPGSPGPPNRRCPPRWPWSAGCSATLPGPRLRAFRRVSEGMARRSLHAGRCLVHFNLDAGVCSARGSQGRSECRMSMAKSSLDVGHRCQTQHRKGRVPRPPPAILAMPPRPSKMFPDLMSQCRTCRLRDLSFSAKGVQSRNVCHRLYS